MAAGQIIQNFESGNLNGWIQSPESRWKTDTVAPLEGRFSLHHAYDNPDNGNDRIGLELKNFHPSAGKSSWSFTVRHGYDPSSSNNWAAFLMSDKSPDMMSPFQAMGFAIGVNITGSDDSLRLVKISNGIIATVLNCRINWQTSVGINNPAAIKVERTADGIWKVTVSNVSGSVISISEGKDEELFAPLWFGIMYRYSSTKDRLLWIDDVKIEGDFHEDNIPPAITSCILTGKSSLRIIFSEQVTNETAAEGNFLLNAEEQPSSIAKIDQLSYDLFFSENFVNKTDNILKIINICDLTGNCREGETVNFTPAWAEPGDVVISEIMANPLPVVSLPPKEYLEITNVTDFTFNSKGWRLKTTEKDYELPEFKVNPGDIFILCSQDDDALFSKFGKTASLKQFPSLTDAGRIICLADSTGSLIHGIEYSDAWYGNELKKEGGWSLEIIDRGMPFNMEDNWKASASRSGGTPGSVNSVSGNNPDTYFRGFENVFPVDSITLKVRFSEYLPTYTSLVRTLKVEGKDVSSVIPDDLLNRTFIVRTTEAIERNREYILQTGEDLKDFAGNPIQRKEFVFGLAEIAVEGDILFNEILFNPFPGDPDFIEFFNVSGKIIDASRLQLVSVSGSDTSGLLFLSKENRCILPGAYYAITTDKRSVLQRYTGSVPDQIFEVNDLPSMPDDKGHLILFNRELERIDEMEYNEDMHYPLLASAEGVSLEKTAPDLGSGEKINWHSASESSGWGTPGFRNSVFIENENITDQVVLSSTRLTPDYDGNEDFLTINFNLSGTGNVVSVEILDERGNPVRKLASVMLSSPQTSLIWDGTADDGSPVMTGIYIVYATLYNDKGKTAKWKKVCAVIRR